MPIFGPMFFWAYVFWVYVFGPTFLGLRFQAYFFWPILLKFFIGAEENIMYWLVMRNQSYHTYLLNFIFWATFGKKIDVAIRRGPSRLVWVLETQTKILSTGWTFWFICYFNINWIHTIQKFSVYKNPF